MHMTKFAGGTKVSAETDGARMRAVARLAGRLLRAMANERRFLILCHLLSGERSVGELQTLIGISQSALSQHLARLRAEELVATRREAQSIYYALADEAVGELVELLQGHLARRVS